jgi:hypothetical protein
MTQKQKRKAAVIRVTKRRVVVKVLNPTDLKEINRLVAGAGRLHTQARSLLERIDAHQRRMESLTTAIAGELVKMNLHTVRGLFAPALEEILRRRPIDQSAVRR